MTHTRSTDHCRDALLALAAEVFGHRALVGCAEVLGADPSTLFPVEHEAIQRAVPLRQQEFAAGRAAARQALGRSLALPMRADRAPVWPDGVQGSITHAGGWALAVIARNAGLIGLDLEVDAPLPPEVFETILTPRERAWLAGQTEAAHWARVIFSAKECAYKAQYARSQQLFGFEVFEVALTPETGSFTATFQQDILPFTKGETLTGRFSRKAGFILTGIAA